MSQESLPTVLVVDDEQRSLESIRRTLDEDFTVFTASSADEARGVLEQRPVNVILCDQRMPGVTGVTFLKEARERWPDTVRIVISGYTDSEDIIAGINEASLYQYILKPWVPDQLLKTVREATEGLALHQRLSGLELDLRRTSTPVLRQRVASRQAQAQSAFDFDRIERGSNSPLNPICAVARRVARYDLPVLVQGESGTGKELIARAIHYASPRAAGRFVVENCAAIPETLLESELFGHKRGAFTGAIEDRAGLFERANGGTVFLDEIGETSPGFQVRLLRVLQEGELRPVGSPRSISVDVRVIAATHRDLETLVREGRFREDLYYRIAGVTLTVPPLRERGGDIEPIARKLVAEVSAEMGCPGASLSREAIACLLGYPWPGNIRELRNEIARAVALSDGPEIPATALSTRVLHGQAGLSAASSAQAPLPQTGTLAERLDAMEAMILRETLLHHRWNKTRAAKDLGLSRVGLRAKMQRFALEG
jgi:two-component system response regulator HupR/HoxA